VTPQQTVADQERGHVALVDPAPDAPVLPPDRVRPGVDARQLPRFGDAVWQLAFLDAKQTAGSKPIHWPAYPATFRGSLKRLAWALLNLPTPEVILSRPWSTSRARLSTSSIHHTLKGWKAFCTWLQDRGVTALAQVDRGLLADYAVSLRTQQRSRNYHARQLLALTRMWAYAPYFQPEDRIPMPPWDEHGTEDYLPAPDTVTGHNARLPIHPATMSPLLVWALRFVTEFATDILTARAERQRLQGNVRPHARPGGVDDLRVWFAQRRATGQPLPGISPFHDYRRRYMIRPRPGRTEALNARYIAGVTGTAINQVQHLLHRCPELLEGLEITNRADLPSTIRGRIDARPWTPGIDIDETSLLLRHLATAALTVVVYLSGMRPEEVLHLERGCCTRTEPSASGVVRYQLTGRHFKGINDPDGNTRSDGEIREQPWVVIAPVAAAISVLEALGEHERLLFPRSLPGVRRERRADPAYSGQALLPDTANHRIRRFVAFANTLARAHGRDHELIPEDPDGPIALSRFRQTVAWFINRRPGGRVALGIQYGHLQLTMAEAYGSRGRTDMLELLDLERARTLADTLTEAPDRLQDGEHVSGPAAERYRASAREFTAAYQGAVLSKRQARALLHNRRLRVFDHPDALLACNHNPLTALCDPNRGTQRAAVTPSFDRCDRACGNIARTDTHIARARAEADALQAEIDSGLNPHPITQRHRQRQETLREIIAAHERTPPHTPPARILTAMTGPAEPTPAASIATAISPLLAQASTPGVRGDADAEEISAITDAMVRLLLGVPLRSDGQLTIKSLAAEAGLKRNKLTHKHTGLKDLFYALVKAQHARPAIVEDLQRDNDELRAKLAKVSQERDQLQQANARFARVVHVLEVENQQLRDHATKDTTVRVLPRPHPQRS